MQGLDYTLRLILFVQIMGIVTFPISFFLFRNIKTIGPGIAKLTGLSLLVYLNFLALSFNTRINFYILNIISISLLCSLSYFIFLKQQSEIKSHIKENLKTLLMYELFFIAIFLMALLIRMWDPNLVGAEKFADYSIFNSIYSGSNLPPADVWFSGQPVNYYYLSHFFYAFISKALLIPPAYAINICVCLVISLIFSLGLSIGHILTNSFKTGILSGLCVSFLGTLSTSTQIINGGFKALNWWNSARVIKNTINEFPFWSFLLGDLHPHYSTLPFLMLFLIIIIDYFKNPANNNFKRNISSYARILLSSVICGFVISSNPWNLPAIAALLCLVFFLKKPKDERSIRLFITSVLKSLVFAAFSIFLFLPFYLGYLPPKSGIAILPLGLTSNLGEFLTVFAFPLTILTFYSLQSFLKGGMNKDKGIFLCLLLVFLSTIFVFRQHFVPVLILALISLNMYKMFSLREYSFEDTLILLALFILLGCEFIYVKDYFSNEFLRLNTVFKFHYVAYLFLIVLTPAMLRRMLSQIVSIRLKRSFILSFIVMFVLCFLFIPLGTFQKNTSLIGKSFYKKMTLNGESFLKEHHPHDYGAINWIKENIPRNSIMLENPSKSFSANSMYSTFSSRPTVLGWSQHEWAWRNLKFEDVSRMIRELKSIYSVEDKTSILDMIKKYKIDYIIVGSTEKDEYSKESLNGFKKVFESIYKNQTVTIYKVSFTSHL